MRPYSGQCVSKKSRGNTYHLMRGGRMQRGHPWFSASGKHGTVNTERIEWPGKTSYCHGRQSDSKMTAGSATARKKLDSAWWCLKSLLEIGVKLIKRDASVAKGIPRPHLLTLCRCLLGHLLTSHHHHYKQNSRQFFLLSFVRHSLY